MQRVPIVALAMYIVFQRGTTPDGPTTRTKLYLILATLLYAFNDFPMNVWAGILPSELPPTTLSPCHTLTLSNTRRLLFLYRQRSRCLSSLHIRLPLFLLHVLESRIPQEHGGMYMDYSEPSTGM